ncbi:hypothetical protein [Gracilibacillus kekensis]|nr:hypothetical protein [Gracilibacillus kekensis]
MLIKRQLILLIAIIILTACNNQTTENLEQQTGNPTAEDILTENKNADLFVLNNVVYSNAESIEWVKEKELTIGKKVAEIQKQTSDKEELDNYAATKLSVGTEIYEPLENSNIFIVKADGKEVRYLGLVEG